MKKVFFLSIAVFSVLMFVFSGCGKGKDKEPNESQTNKGSEYLGDIEIVNIASNSIKLKTEIKNTNQLHWIECGYCWTPQSNEKDVTYNNNPVDLTEDPHSQTVILGEIDRLQENTTYLVRAYLLTADSVYYSKRITIETASPSSNTDALTLNSLTDKLTYIDNKKDGYPITVSATVTGLNKHTAYYIRSFIL